MMKLLFIGAVNKHNSPLGGEVYKNQLLEKRLIELYELKTIDTYKWEKKPTVILLLFFALFFQNWDSIVVSASSHSVYRLVNILYYFKNLRSRCIYMVIGGYFPQAVEAGIFRKKPYEKLKAIVLEGEKLRNTLVKTNYNGSIYVVPNFKEFPSFLPQIKNKGIGITRFVFVSRIQRYKGVDLIFEASKLLINSGINNFSITFFGPVDSEYSDVFLENLSNNLIYGGFMDIIKSPGPSYHELSGYDVMLFPTYWKGEGFPGVLIDAFIAGLPVIASDWNMNDEIIINDVNGLLIPPKNAHALARAMEQMITDSSLRNRLSRSSLECAKKYKIDNIIPLLKEIIEA